MDMGASLEYRFESGRALPRVTHDDGVTADTRKDEDVGSA